MKMKHFVRVFCSQVYFDSDIHSCRRALAQVAVLVLWLETFNFGVLGGWKQRNKTKFSRRRQECRNGSCFESTVSMEMECSGVVPNSSFINTK